MDYQKTVNLPQTNFAMKASLAQREPQLLKTWEEGGLYAALRVKSRGCSPYILHDGPPYANGDIHIGHALNKILKDMIVKMKTMQGRDAHYVPGWDCHGLPIEHQLFKDLKKRKSDVDTLEFRQKAHEYAMKYVGVQREQFKRLGVFGDWEKPYLTLAPEYEYWILHSFARLTQDGYVYRGLKPVNWCANCETALAEAEVEYEDHSSPSVYVKFRVKNPQEISGLPKGKSLCLLIWTTTPWTLLANVAVAVQPAFQYIVADVGAELLVIEESLAPNVLAKGGVKDYQIVKTVPGRELGALRYEQPFGVRADGRVITVDYVTKEDGTGLVHTAPGHGQEDYEAGREHQLEILMPVDDRGLFTSEAGKFAGQHVFKANDEIMNDLQSRGLLLASEKIAHSYPHCWRCKKPIIFRATKQWFLKIDHRDLRRKLKTAIDNQVQWIPPAGKERILGMVISRPDWCLSRQRHWGVPIPALSCQGCGGEHRLYPEVIEHFANLVKREGTDAWFSREVKDLVPEGFVCPSCQSAHFTKTFDILDVWFDSGVSHQAVVGPMLNQKIPVDLYLEGSDQHRGWFQSSLIPAVALEGKPPFAAVLTHGFVVDGQGRKMSKSLGNVISPQDVIKNNGVDILRLWVASSNYNDDIRLSPEILERLIDAYRKIRNTLRYLLGNLSDFDPMTDVLTYQQLLPVDQLALNQLSEQVSQIKSAYNEFEFGRVYKAIYAYCNENLSGFYLDILKDRLYTSPAQSPERRSAQTVLYHILNHLVRLLAPVLSFTADEVFLHMPKDQDMKKIQSVHLLDWLEVPAEWADAAIKEQFSLLLDLRPFVLKSLEDKRKEAMIGSSLEAEVILESASKRDCEYFHRWENSLPAFFIVSSVSVKEVREVNDGLGDMFPKTRILVRKASGEKCCRCWNYSSSLGHHAEHPLLCARCVKAVLGC